VRAIAADVERSVVCVSVWHAVTPVFSRVKTVESVEIKKAFKNYYCQRWIFGTRGRIDKVSPRFLEWVQGA